MNVDFDLYVPGNSVLHRLDPRVKLLLVIESILGLFLFMQFAVAVGFLLAIHLLLLVAGIPLQRLRILWRLLLPLTLLIPTLWLIFQPGPGEAFLMIGPLRLTWEALRQGVTAAVRLDALAFVMFLWLFTTEQTAIVRGFTALGVPYPWGLTLALALRYIPTIAEIYQQVMDAQRARGLDLESGGFWRRLQAYHPILVAVLISALRTSQGLAWSLEARGLGAPGVRRTQFRRLRFSTWDWAVTGLLVSILALGLTLFWWKFQ
jgi:energy-coupling factor transport system permease protein